MSTLPQPVVAVLELAERGGVRKDDLPQDDQTRTALRICRRRNYVGFPKRFGPEPPKPKRSTKPARDLKKGDILAIGDRGHVVLWAGPPPRSSVPSGGGYITVDAEGCPEPRIYRPGARVTVLDGPILPRPCWEELVLEGDGRMALDEHRLIADLPAKENADGWNEEEYTYEGELLTSGVCKKRFDVTSHDLSSDADAKKFRRRNPEGRQGGDYIYRHKDVSRIADRKDRNRR